MNMGQYRVLDLVTLGLRDSRENIGKYGGLRKTTFMRVSGASRRDSRSREEALGHENYLVGQAVSISPKTVFSAHGISYLSKLAGLRECGGRAGAAFGNTGCSETLSGRFFDAGCR